MVQEERLKAFNHHGHVRGSYVLYWMQASQRVEYNHALSYAAERANELKLPLVVFFGLTDDYLGANLRHYSFMLEGLREVQAALREMGVKLVVRRFSPPEGALELSREASLVVVDCGYLRTQRQWREWVSSRIERPFIQVESDVVVPIEIASPKEEYAAATIRRKIGPLLEDYLVPLEMVEPKKSSLAIDLDGIDLSDTGQVISGLNIDRDVKVPAMSAGISAAKAKLDDFLERKLGLYAEKRNEPSLDVCSGMSPYLHFGQISPLYIALTVRQAGGPEVEAYLEELIVRRELSMNFVYYNPLYDSLEALPDWAITTLREHAGDEREFIYSLRELEEAHTHDPYWNAAQQEMVATGRMHNYMRMYWGKKIIEWSASPPEAHRTAIYLNDKYEMDGRDPNGYAGILWCFGKHDRAWKEREVLGKVRYMSSGGLRRKFDMDTYIRTVGDVYREYMGPEPSYTVDQ